MQIQKGVVQVLLHDHSSFHSVPGFTPLISGQLLQVPEKGAATVLVLHLQEILGVLKLLLGQLEEEVAHTLKGHIDTVKIAQREVGVRGLKVWVDQVVDRSFHWSGKILRNLGVHDCQAIGVKLKKWCWLVLEAEDG